MMAAILKHNFALHCCTGALHMFQRRLYTNPLRFPRRQKSIRGTLNGQPKQLAQVFFELILQIFASFAVIVWPC